MKIGQVYSHLNGLEFLLVHQSALWDEVRSAVWRVDAEKAFDKISKEKTMVGRRLYSPSALNRLFKMELSPNGWREMRTPYFVNEDLQTTRETVDMRDKEAQRQAILHRGFQAFLGLMERYAPSYFVHGHVHLSYNYKAPRICTYENTTVVNAYERTVFEFPPIKQQPVPQKLI